MSNTATLAAAIVVSATMTSAVSASTLFDFEDFKNDSTVTTLSADGIDLTLTAIENLSGDATQAGVVKIFDTLLAENVPADDDLVSDTITDGILKTSKFGKVLIINESDSTLSPDDNRRGGSITFSFSKAVDLLSFDVVDDATLTVSAPGQTDIFEAVSDDGGFSTRSGTPLFANVTEFTFTFAQSGAIDNIIVAAVAPPSEIPLPAALPLLLAGLGGLGLMGRRKAK